MNLAELERINAATLKKLAEDHKAVDYGANPYYGFYTADLFECPPFVMFTAHDCPRASNILYDRFFEQMSMKVWCRFVPQATGICDIGAHVGVYSLAAASLRRDISIQAFEPNPYAFTRLRMHKMVNGFSNIIENRFALAHQDGHTSFSWVIKPGFPISSGGGMSKGKEGKTETVVVQVKIFDELPAASQLGERGLIKVDVEGAEAMTFKGMRQAVQSKPDIILETFSQQSCDLINDMLLPLGYRSYHIHEHEGVMVEQERVMPCTIKSGNFNQFLTTRPDEDVRRIMA